MHVFSPGASGRLLLLLGLVGLVACDPNDNPPTPCVEGSDRPECVPDSGTPGPGQDDHGNTPAEATPITPATEPLTGAFDASGELDVFSAPGAAWASSPPPRTGPSSSGSPRTSPLADSRREAIPCC